MAGCGLVLMAFITHWYKPTEQSGSNSFRRNKVVRVEVIAIAAGQDVNGLVAGMSMGRRTRSGREPHQCHPARWGAGAVNVVDQCAPPALGGVLRPLDTGR